MLFASWHASGAVQAALLLHEERFSRKRHCSACVWTHSDGCRVKRDARKPMCCHSHADCLLHSCSWVHKLPCQMLQTCCGGYFPIMRFGCAHAVVPNGVSTGLDIGLSNYSLMLITLSFYTMCKSTTPVFLLTFAFIWGIEKCAAPAPNPNPLPPQTHTAPLHRTPCFHDQRLACGCLDDSGADFESGLEGCADSPLPSTKA